MRDHISRWAANAGVVYSLDSADSLTVPYAFAAGADGGYPMAGVFLSSTGKLFGTTYNDGKNGAGVVYEMIETDLYLSGRCYPQFKLGLLSPLHRPRPAGALSHSMVFPSAQ